MKNFVISFVIIAGVFAGGFLSGQYFADAEIIEKKVVEYKTQWKIKPVNVNFVDCVRHLESPIIINHRIEDNWIKIKAHDSVKSAKKDVLLECQTDDWKMQLTIGAICFSAGLGLMLLK